MRKHNYNPKNNGTTNSTKDKEITLIPEPFLPGFFLIGVWMGEVELAAFVAPIEVWKDRKEMTEIVNVILANTIQKRVK